MMFNLVVFIILACTSLSSYGNNSQFLIMLNQAKILMNYSGHVDLPAMIPKTEKQLNDMFCPGMICSVSALYIENTVYYDDRIDYKRDAIDRSIIIHELIHHIQSKKYGTTYDCGTWFRKERQAYKLQAQYLRARGLSASFVNDITASLKCPKSTK